MCNLAVTYNNLTVNSFKPLPVVIIKLRQSEDIPHF